jgi:hypothetical protein
MSGKIERDMCIYLLLFVTLDLIYDPILQDQTVGGSNSVHEISTTSYQLKP